MGKPATRPRSSWISCPARNFDSRVLSPRCVIFPYLPHVLGRPWVGAFTLWESNGGFNSHGGTPSSLDGLFHGKYMNIYKWMKTGGTPISGNHQISQH